jgi:hypothetical protein
MYATQLRHCAFGGGGGGKLAFSDPNVRHTIEVLRFKAKGLEFKVKA